MEDLIAPLNLVLCLYLRIERRVVGNESSVGVCHSFSLQFNTVRGEESWRGRGCEGHIQQLHAQVFLVARALLLAAGVSMASVSEEPAFRDLTVFVDRR